MRELRYTNLYGDSKEILPFYTADRTLQESRTPYTVDRVLRTVFSERYEEGIKTYIERVPDAVREAIDVKDAKDFKLIGTEKPIVESSWIQDCNNVKVDLKVQATIEADVPIETWRAGLIIVTREKRDYTLTFRVRYILDLIKKQCSAPAIAPVAFFPKDDITESPCANEYLLPIMKRKDYVLAARKLLEKYYPEALEKPMKIDGFELAKKMKLKVAEVWFDERSDVLGRIFFDKELTHVDIGIGVQGYYWFGPRTILINRNLCKTAAMLNSTIIHECCHYFLDLPFFKLQILCGKPFVSHTSRTKTKQTPVEGPEYQMERQAEKLPAYILMEEQVTRKEIERLMAERGGIRSYENLRFVLESLTKTFGVSRSMAKYRMIELGYPEAEGIYNFADINCVPDHGCGNGWKPGITYVISKKEAAAIAIENPAFLKVMESGQFIYIEGHFCRDTEKYIERYPNGLTRLTVYARNHVDECCISFIARGNNWKVEYNKSLASKKKPSLGMAQTSHDLDSIPNTEERLDQNKKMCEDAVQWMNYKSNIPNDIKAAIYSLMKDRDVTHEEISMRLGIARPTFSGWFKGRLSLKHIVAICIALDVRVDIGLELVRIGGYQFLNTTEHAVLLSFLIETKKLTVARANEILVQKKLKPLTEGKSQELAEVM